MQYERSYIIIDNVKEVLKLYIFNFKTLSIGNTVLEEAHESYLNSTKP